jgi:hypothetical protein
LADFFGDLADFFGDLAVVVGDDATPFVVGDDATPFVVGGVVGDDATTTFDFKLDFDDPTFVVDTRFDFKLDFDDTGFDDPDDPVDFLTIFTFSYIFQNTFLEIHFLLNKQNYLKWLFSKFVQNASSAL